MLGFEQSHIKNSNEKDNYKFTTSAIVPIEYTNAIAYGQTGSGKSTGFILPNIINRLEHEHNLIIYDYKSTLITSVLAILREHDALDRLCELGTEWGERLNILPILDIDEILSWLRSFDSGKETYWINSAATLFEMLYKALSYIYEACQILDLDYANFTNLSPHTAQERYELSFSDIYSFVDEYKIDALCTSIVALLEIASQHTDPIYGFYQSKLYECHAFLIKFSSANLADTSSASGNKGVIGVLKNALSSIANAEFLNDKSNTLLPKFSQKLALIIHPFGLDYFAVSLLSMAIFKVLKSPQTPPSTVFVDEAHKILSKGFMPEVSVCREYRFEYIISAQDQSQLEQIYGELYNQFSSNIAHQISFYNPLNPICENLRTFEFRVLETSKNKSNATSLATAYFHADKVAQVARLEYFARCFERFDVYLAGKPAPLGKSKLSGAYLSSANSLTHDVYLIKNSTKQKAKLLPRDYETKHASSIQMLIEASKQEYGDYQEYMFQGDDDDGYSDGFDDDCDDAYDDDYDDFGGPFSYLSGSCDDDGSCDDGSCDDGSCSCGGNSDCDCGGNSNSCGSDDSDDGSSGVGNSERGGPYYAKEFSDFPPGTCDGRCYSDWYCDGCDDGRGLQGTRRAYTKTTTQNAQNTEQNPAQITEQSKKQSAHDAITLIRNKQKQTIKIIKQKSAQASLHALLDYIISVQALSKSSLSQAIKQITQENDEISRHCYALLAFILEAYIHNQPTDPSTT